MINWLLWFKMAGGFYRKPLPLQYFHLIGNKRSQALEYLLPISVCLVLYQAVMPLVWPHIRGYIAG
jgi:hypothetical protein